jgi:hypothetical protein
MAPSKPHHSIINKLRHHSPVNVWCGLTGNQLMGPFTLTGHLTPDYHMYFLQDELPHILEDASLQVRLSMWLHYDRIQPHFSQQVTRVLKRLIWKLLEWYRMSVCLATTKFPLVGK